MGEQTSYAIRDMEVGDLANVLAWRNHPDVRRYMLTQHEISPAEHEAWFTRTSQDPNRRLLIVEQRAGPIGFVHFTQAFPGGVSEWGFYVVPGSPKGTGRTLGSAGLRYAFRELRVHKVCGAALDFNEASIRFHVGLGFRQEGVLRGQHRIGDRYCDLVCFGMLSDEWTHIHNLTELPR